MNEANAGGFCVNCGQPLIAGARFCVGCGAERTAPPQETAPVVPPEPAPIPPPPAPVAAPVVPLEPAPIPPPPAPVAAPVVPLEPAPAPPVTTALPVTSSPATAPSSGRTRAILTGLIIGLVIVGVIFAIWKLSSGSKSASSTTTTPLATVAPTAPPTVAPQAVLPVVPVTPPATLATPPATQQAADEAGALNGMLLNSVSKRSAINPAVTYIGGCTAIDAGKKAFTDALASRQSLIGQLEGQSLALLPQGDALKSTLIAAWQSSIQADTSYIAWANALEASPPCNASTSYQDQNFLDAHTEDGTSTYYKGEFVTLWNKIAPAYGFQQQTKYSI